jgi:two-component system sensor histidine kinase KdpD
MVTGGRLNVKNSLDLMFPTQTTFVINPKEHGVMQWVDESAQAAGKGTDNLNFSNSLYLPLLSGGRCLGVIGLQMQHHADMLASQKKMLIICLQQLANIIDVETQVLDEKQEKMRAVKQETKDHVLKGFIVQIYQPLLQFVDKLKKVKAAPKFF